MTRRTRPASGAPRGKFRSLTVSGGFKEYVLAQLAELGEVTARAMFGGVGLYRGDLFFGIVAADVLYLKVDDENRHEYEAAGMSPFAPFEGRGGSRHYFQVPVGVLESATDLVRWARRSVDAAARGASLKPRRGASSSG